MIRKIFSDNGVQQCVEHVCNGRPKEVKPSLEFIHLENAEWLAYGEGGHTKTKISYCPFCGVKLHTGDFVTIATVSLSQA